MTETWQSIARTLQIGSKRKVECCSTDRSASVRNTDKGISIKCYRCGYTDFEPHGQRSIAEILATRRAIEALENTETPIMPSDAVSLADAPREAWVWLLKGGMTPEAAERDWGFKWHEPTRRILIPIPGGLLGRAVFNERPKYKMFTNKPGALYWPSRSATGPAIAVEDILSAIAIYRAGGCAVAVLGTSLSASQAAEISLGRDTVVGWFDPDKAGDNAWNLLRRRMSLFPVTTKRIQTRDDPKRLPRAQLEAILKDIGE